MVTRAYACSGGAFCVLALVILATLSLSTMSDFKNIAVWEDG
ncbi:rCG63345, partial [Rattus norvegicus]